MDQAQAEQRVDFSVRENNAKDQRVSLAGVFLRYQSGGKATCRAELSTLERKMGKTNERQT